MKHYKQFVAGYEKQRKEGILPNEDMGRKHFLRMALAFSSRIDILEKFITSNTDFNGERVGFNGSDDKKIGFGSTDKE